MEKSGLQLTWFTQEGRQEWAGKCPGRGSWMIWLMLCFASIVLLTPTTLPSVFPTKGLRPKLVGWEMGRAWSTGLGRVLLPHPQGDSSGPA